MTQIQVDYLKHLETVRANKAREAETRRANLVSEAETQRHNFATEWETARKNQASESLTAGYNLEISRHNQAVEAISYSQLGLDTQKHLETVRHNQAGEEISAAQTAETIRHNQALEPSQVLANRGSYMRGQSGLISAETGQYLAGYEARLREAQAYSARESGELSEQKQATEKFTTDIARYSAEKSQIDLDYYRTEALAGAVRSVTGAMDSVGDTAFYLPDKMFEYGDHLSGYVKDFTTEVRNVAGAAKDAVRILPW